MSQEAFEINDFSGGITDYHIDGSKNCAQIIDNFYINNNSELKLRQGSRLFIPRKLPFPGRISQLFFMNNEPFVFYAGRICRIINGEFFELQGYGEQSLFQDRSDTILSTATWRGHLYATHSNYGHPQKIYRDQEGNYQVNAMGLPAVNARNFVIAYLDSITLTKPSVPSRPNFRTVFRGISAYNNNQTTNTNRNTSRTGYGPPPPPGFFPEITGERKHYIYAFVYKYTYYVDGVKFEDRGPVFYTSIIGIPEIGVRNVPLLNSSDGRGVTEGGERTKVAVRISLPNLSSFENYEENTNWDFSKIVLEIYRTQDSQTRLFKLGEHNFTNRNNFFVDQATDEQLSQNLLLYASNNVIPNFDPPPRCKFIHVEDDVAYYANLQLEDPDAENGFFNDENLIRQSIPGNPDAVPEFFQVSANERITGGIASIFSRTLVFCEKHIYRINGTIAADGTGDIRLETIDDQAGCVSNGSIVVTEKGLFWAGRLGFYWTDGLRVINVTNHLNKTYQNLVRTPEIAEKIKGNYDSNKQLVYWAVSKKGSENDTVFVLDIKRDFTSGRGVFTTFSGGENFKPTVFLPEKDKIYRADPRGYLFTHSDDDLNDPKINEDEDPTNWHLTPILYQYRSCAWSFGSRALRKYVTRIMVNLLDRFDVSLGINSINDNAEDVRSLKPIIQNTTFIWDNPNFVWGNPSFVWRENTKKETWRHFPARTLRCNYKQVEFVPIRLEIASSDTLGVVFINGNNITLLTENDEVVWPINATDYIISFTENNYQRKYAITGRTNRTITVDTSFDPLPPVTQRFILEGIPFSQPLTLIGYVIYYTPLSSTFLPYTK